MSCPNCDCHDCRSERDRRASRPDIVILHETWAWDATPGAAAEVLLEHGFDNNEVAAIMRSLRFSEDAITSVAVGMS